MEAAEGIGGYAAKVRISTGLAGGEAREWPVDVLKDYIASAARCSHGRQGFRLQIKPQAAKTISRSIEVSVSNEFEFELIEAMPIIL